MRILLDESVPHLLGRLLIRHSFSSVQREGWSSMKNGELLALAAGSFDVLLTADKGMEYQQNQEARLFQSWWCEPAATGLKPWRNYYRRY